MITIDNNEHSGESALNFRFPGVHPKAKVEVSFQRTLRVPDDGESYPLPAGLGKLPLKHVEDYPERFSDHLLRRGGVLMPMYQSEATWLNFSGGYPMAIKVATGKVNAITGDAWVDALSSNPQDYMVTPDQDWLDGFCIEKGKVRQFVAQPLGKGKTVEEIMTQSDEWGGIQLMIYPMKASEYIKRFETVQLRSDIDDGVFDIPVYFKRAPDMECSMSMGIAAGGLIEQEIYEDEFGIEVWDTSAGARCFIHLVNSTQYSEVTGEPTPHRPITKNEYLKAGIPWFESYKEAPALHGGKFDLLRKLRSVRVGEF